MVAGKWFMGATGAEKAVEWGVDASTVRGIATDASRVVRTLVNLDPDEARARLFAALDEHRRQGLAADDVKAANQSVGIQAQLLGLVSTNVRVSVDAQRVAAMTPAERLEECLRVRAELDEEIADLRKRVKGVA